LGVTITANNVMTAAFDAPVGKMVIFPAMDWGDNSTKYKSCLKPSSTNITFTTGSKVEKSGLHVILQAGVPEL